MPKIDSKVLWFNVAQQDIAKETENEELNKQQTQEEIKPAIKHHVSKISLQADYKVQKCWL